LGYIKAYSDRKNRDIATIFVRDGKNRGSLPLNIQRCSRHRPKFSFCGSKNPLDNMICIYVHYRLPLYRSDRVLPPPFVV